MIDILIAVVIDWIIGDPYWFPHPVIYIGRLIRFLEKGARRYSKNNFQLKCFGGGIVLIVSIVSFMIPFSVLKIAKTEPILYHIVNIFILWTTLAARSLHIEGKKVYSSLKGRDIKDARIKLSYIVGRDTTQLSEKELIRADVETISENTSDGIIAPLFYALIGGAPLAMMYKGINTMDSTLGYLNEKYRYIGFFSAKIDDLFNLLPARLTGIFMCVAAPLVKGNIIESFKIMIRDRKNHKSPNCAYPEAATAGALRVQLGGSNIYFGEVMEKPTIGDKIRELDKEDINKTIILMYASEIILVIIGTVLNCYFVK